MNKSKKTFWSSKRSPFIIAEMSGNHNKSLDRALELVDAAASCGADAIKLQTYTADTMTLDIQNDEFMINDPSSLWYGQSMYQLFEKAHTPWEWHLPIMERAKQRSLLCFSSPFDASAVDFLENLNVPAYKIASFECVDIPLIKKVASTGKPMLISTGMATISEISDAVSAAKDYGCEDITLLKCTSTYPASAENTNLQTISHMRHLFNCQVGISDHTLGIGVSVAAVAFGASVIEKHFTLSRSDGGVDSKFSLEPSELASLVKESNQAWHALGEIKYGPTKAEEKAKLRRRSLYINEDMNIGDIISSKNLCCIRPGHGISPKYYEIFLGRKVKKSVKRGTPVTWDLL
ncbi:pseudaminic acid synthase [bacterium]|jgi:pseudaminic acid synthase|nr:pseudaminic acid synthase [bacterium]